MLARLRRLEGRAAATAAPMTAERRAELLASLIARADAYLVGDVGDVGTGRQTDAATEAHRARMIELCTRQHTDD